MEKPRHSVDKAIVSVISHLGQWWILEDMRVPVSIPEILEKIASSSHLMLLFIVLVALRKQYYVLYMKFILK